MPRGGEFGAFGEYGRRFFRFRRSVIAPQGKGLFQGPDTRPDGFFYMLFKVRKIEVEQ
jgi:hypothetical protein